MRELIEELRNNSETPVFNYIDLNQSLKDKIIDQDHKILGLTKDLNKLQDLKYQLEEENCFLRQEIYIL